MSTSKAAGGRGVGKVYLVGAGPGDPGLITLRGTFLLKRAEVVVYDYLANRKLLQHAPAGALFIYAGKKGGGLHAFTQEQINALLVRHALEGKRVVRLKGGDPFIFGRGAEEIEELVRHGVPFEVVPGVTSATAAATYAGIPITHRGYTSSVAFVTGHEDPTKEKSDIDWEKLATGVGTIVVYMGIKNLPVITRKLMEHGRSPRTPAAVVRWASTPHQHSVQGTLENITDIVHRAGIRPPALVIVGEVVGLRNTIDWFEKRPLFGRRIVVTRTREQASELVAALEEQGAECLEHSTINIEPVDDYRVLDEALQHIDSYRWLLFTSLNAVRYFFSRLEKQGMDTRDLKGPRIGAVGKTTAESLLRHGIRVDLLPEKFTGEGLAASLIATDDHPGPVLIPRALQAREVLPNLLEAAGYKVTIAPVYRNVPPVSEAGGRDVLRRELAAKKIDMVTFTSSSTVTNFLRLVDAENQDDLHALMQGTHIAAIGPITAKTVRNHGLSVDVQPRKYTIAEMVRSIVDFYREGGDRSP